MNQARVGAAAGPAVTLRQRASEVLARLPARELRTRATVDGSPGGLHRGLRRGGGVEFAEHREYAPGDDLRHLDWRAYARNDRYLIKRYEQEVHASLTLLVDASASMSLGEDGAAGAAEGLSKMDAVRLLAATLACLTVRQGDAVGLLAVGRRRQHLAPAGGETHLWLLLDALQRIRPDGAEGLESIDRADLGGIKRRGAVVVLSDVLAEPARALAPLSAMARLGPQVVLLQCLHPLEIHLDFRDAVELACAERGSRHVIDPRVARAAYGEMMRAHIGRVRAQATQVGVHHLLVDLSDDPAEIVARLLLVLAAPTQGAQAGRGA